MNERRVALLGGMLAGLGPLALSLFTPAMPAISTILGATDAAVKSTLSIYFAGFAFAQLLSGTLSDRFGRKLVTQAFLLLFFIGSVGTLFVTTIEALFWSRLLQGIGAAGGIVIARAIVRDLFTGDVSTRILNVSSIIIGLGPAVAPAIGGGAMLLAGWRAPFVIMFLLGVISLVVVHCYLVETRPAGTGRFDITGLVGDYRTVLANPRFFWSSMTNAGAVGTFYAQSTALSYVVIDQLGHNPGEFGLLMLFVSGAYLAGALVVSQLIPRIGASPLTRFGLMGLTATMLSLTGLYAMFPPSLPTIILPVAGMIFSNAFILPAMYTASLAPFPERAGAASAMSGFLTMGLGLLGSLAISQVSDPSLGLALVDPILVGIAVGSYLMWRRQTAT